MYDRYMTAFYRQWSTLTQMNRQRNDKSLRTSDTIHFNHCSEESLSIIVFRISGIRQMVTAAGNLYYNGRHNPTNDRWHGANAAVPLLQSTWHSITFVRY